MQRGFTVIELVIVMAIIGIVGGLCVPRIEKSIAEHNLDTTARMLEADIRLVQQRAVNTIPGQGYPIIKFSTNKTPNSYYITQQLRTIKWVDLPKDVILSGVPKTLAFGINGTPVTDDLALPTTLFLTSKKTSMVRHIMIASSGRVRIDNSTSPDDIE